MRLRLTLTKEYNNEANMRSQRDTAIAEAKKAGFTTNWTVEE